MSSLAFNLNKPRSLQQNECLLLLLLLILLLFSPFGHVSWTRAGNPLCCERLLLDYCYHLRPYFIYFFKPRPFLSCVTNKLLISILWLPCVLLHCRLYLYIFNERKPGMGVGVKSLDVYCTDGTGV